MTNYKTDLLDLRQGDCMDLMRETPDGWFDLAIVDPPYGIGEDGGKTLSRVGKSKAWKNQKVKDYASKKWDSSPPCKKYFSEVRRVSKNQIIWGANHFIDRMPWPSPCWIVWKKNGQNPNSDFADAELALTSFKTAVRHFDFAWSGFGAVNAKEDRIHPTQKPVALYRWLLANYAKPGQRILDTHLGSGSHAIACHYAGLHLTATELDPDYFQASVERIKRETAQATLFPLQPAQRVEQGAFDLSKN